jgi:hypothetical protein
VRAQKGQTIVLQGEGLPRKLLVSVDVKGYGRRDDRQRRAVQDDLLAMLDEAAALAGLSRSSWERHPGGDGELAILPASESDLRVVDDFVRELRTALEHHNHDLLPEARLRLRMAIHYGVVDPSSNGYTGGGVTDVSRMLDSDQLRAALDDDEAYLAVMISGRLFAETIAQRHTSLKEADFRRVRIRNKEYAEHAWLYVPGVDVHSLDIPEDHVDGPSAVPDERSAAERGAPARSADGRDQATVSNTFNGPVHAPRSVFGISQR